MSDMLNDTCKLDEMSSLGLSDLGKAVKKKMFVNLHKTLDIQNSLEDAINRCHDRIKEISEEKLEKER